MPVAVVLECEWEKKQINIVLFSRTQLCFSVRLWEMAVCVVCVYACVCVRGQWLVQEDLIGEGGVTMLVMPTTPKMHLWQVTFIYKMAGQHRSQCYICILCCLRT